MISFAIAALMLIGADKTISALFVRRPNDLKRAVAFLAPPNVKDVLLIAILGSFGGNHLIAAVFVPPFRAPLSASRLAAMRCGRFIQAGSGFKASIRTTEGIRIVEVSGRGPAPPVHSSPQCEVQQVLSP
jgi:hypothetical protein